MALTTLTNAQADRLPAYSFRNRLINGDMRIDQRNAFGQQIITTANVTIGTYTCDRWSVIPTGNSVAGKANSSGYTLTGNTGLTAVSFLQRLEANNIQDWIGTTVALQAKISASSLTSITWNAYYPNNALDTWGTAANNINFANGTFTINTTPTVYTASFAVNSSCSNGMGIYFTTGALGLANTLTIKDVQLESGSVPSPFERLMMGQQIPLCQRYYQKSYREAELPGTANTTGNTGILGGVAATTVITSVYVHVILPVQLRASTNSTFGVTTYDVAGTAGKVSATSAGNWSNGVTPTLNCFTDRSFNVTAAGEHMVFNYTVNVEL